MGENHRLNGVKNELKRVAGTQLDPVIVEAAIDQELVVGFDYAH